MMGGLLQPDPGYPIERLAIEPNRIPIVQYMFQLGLEKAQKQTHNIYIFFKRLITERSTI